MDWDGHAWTLFPSACCTFAARGAGLGDAASPPELDSLGGGRAPPHPGVLVLDGPLQTLLDDRTTRAYGLGPRRGVPVFGKKYRAVLVGAIAGC